MNEPSEPATSGNEGQTTDGNICPVEGEEGQTPEPAEKPSGEPASDESDKGANEGEEKKPQSESSPARARLSGWKARFVDTLTAERGNVFKACEAGNVSRATAYKHKGQDEVFGHAWDDAIEGMVDSVEQSVMARAEADPQLAQFVLKTRRRAIYGEKLEVTGSILHGHVAVTPELLSQKAAEALQSFSPLMKALTDAVPSDEGADSHSKDEK